MTMTSHLVFRVLPVLGAFALVAVVAVTAVAQPAPAQVVQGTDGTLYLLQGGKAWTLVPGQISDDAVSNLALSGEIDSVIPPDLLSVPAPAAPAASAPAASQPQTRVDVNKELNAISTGTCNGTEAKASTLILSLASVDRQASGRLVWHVGLANHGSVPIHLMQSNSYWDSSSAAYVLASDGAKYDAFAIDDPTIVAVEERKTLDIIPQQNNMPAGAYRLFFATRRMTFGGMVFNQYCDNWLWSSAPISVP